MRRTWLILYTGAMAAALAVAIAFAARGYEQAHRDARWNDQAKAAARVAAIAAQRAQLAEARYAAATAEYAKLTATVTAATKALSAEIAKTKSIKRKIITGSTIVSYVTAPTKAG
jgi:hypothetical protein